MSSLSEVATLIGQRADEIEKAREIFTSEIRAFVTGVLAGLRRARPDWTTPRVRIDLPRDIETEQKAGYLTNQFAAARCDLRFRKDSKYVAVAEARFGIEFIDAGTGFCWFVTVLPSARYHRLDDVLWQGWKVRPDGAPPGASHLDKANTVRFVCRQLDASLTAEMAYNDLKDCLEYLVTSDQRIAEAVGLDLSGDD